MPKTSLRRGGTSLPTNLVLLAVVPLAIGLSIALGLSIGLFRDATRSEVQRQVERVGDAALENVNLIRTTTEVVAASYARNPALIVAVAQSDAARLRTLAVAEFDAVRAVLPMIATFELTNAAGVVVMRGHNPDRSGDDKSGTALVRAALDSRSASGIEVSPTSGQTAIETIVPLRSGTRIVGTLKVGAYLNAATANRIRALTGAEVVFVASGRVPGSTISDLQQFEIPAEAAAELAAGRRTSRALTLRETSYEVAYVPLQASNGATVATIALLLSQAASEAAEAGLVTRLALAGLLLMCICGVGAFFFSRTISRPLLRLVDAMRAIAKGEIETRVPYRDRSHEIGAMAGAVEVFRTNAVALREADEERETNLATERSRATAIAELATAVSEVVAAAQQGDFSRRAKGSEALGELSRIVDGLNGICETADAFLSALDTSAQALEAGDLTKFLPDRFGGRFAEVGSSLNRAVGEIGGVVARVQDGAQRTAAASAEIGGTAAELAHRNEAQAANLEEMSATVEQFSQSVEETAESTAKLSNQTRAALTRAETGDKLSAEAIQAMGQIEESSGRIRDIVALIDSIAFQTNLLALNASVEAARAGEAGRGFAVVAEEVRRLAQQSGDAAKNIRGLIDVSTTQVRGGADLVRRAGEALGEIVGTVREVARSVEDVSNACQTQSRSVQEITKAISGLDEITQRNAQASDENARSSADLSSYARDLHELVSRFRTVPEIGAVARAA